jgi:hypothetical protein
MAVDGQLKVEEREGYSVRVRWDNVKWPGQW